MSGKPRALSSYIGGYTVYTEKVEDIDAGGYRAFTFEKLSEEVARN